MELNSKENTFINMIKAPCIEAGTREKILPSVVAALAIIISDWGTTKDFFCTRNVFMIPVLNDWFFTCWSKLSGETYNSPSECPEFGVPLYRVYSDHQKSVEDFISYLATAKRSKNGPYKYTSVIGCVDYRETVNRLVRAGFLQDYLGKINDIGYIENIVAIIEKYHLFDWDETLIKEKKSYV